MNWLVSGWGGVLLSSWGLVAGGLDGNAVLGKN